MFMFIAKSYLTFCEVRLFAKSCTEAYQASPSFIISQSLPKLMSTESGILQPYHPLLSASPAFDLSQHQGLFQ